MLRCFPKVACFLLCKCRGADVTDIVQPLFLKPIQQLQDFDEGFHEFRCEFCGREDTSADALVEGLCFLHTFKTCLIFFLYSKHSTVTNRACHWKEPINWRSPCVENCNCVGRIPTSLYPRWTYTIGANVQCYQPVSSVSKCRAQPTLKSQMSCIMICISVFMFEF